MKKTINRIIPAMLVLVALTSLSFMGKDGVILRLKPQQGKTYTIVTKANMMTMMEVQGQSMNMTQNMETRQTLTANEVSDNQVVIETQIEAIKMSVSQMGMKMEYDSEHPEKTSPMLAGQTDELSKAIKKMETVKYDAMGNLTDTLDPGMSQLGAVITQLPEKEVSVGSTWSFDKKQVVSGTEIHAKYTYTVTAISKKSVDVSIVGAIESKDIEGSYEGTASLDPKTGMVTKSNIKNNISMTVSEQGMSIPMTIIGNTTVEMK